MVDAVGAPDLRSRLDAAVTVGPQSPNGAGQGGRMRSGRPGAGLPASYLCPLSADIGGAFFRLSSGAYAGDGNGIVEVFSGGAYRADPERPAPSGQTALGKTE